MGYANKVSTLWPRMTKENDVNIEEEMSSKQTIFTWLSQKDAN